MRIVAFLIFFIIGMLNVQAQDVPENAPPEKNTPPYIVTGLQMRNHLAGPVVTPETFKNKLVYFLHWGVHCPMCIPTMPVHQALYELYGTGDRFTFFSTNVMPQDDFAMDALLTEHGMTFPVYQFATLSLGAPIGDIPYAYLVSPRGKILAEGHPSALYFLIENARLKLPDTHLFAEKLKLETPLGKTLYAQTRTGNITPLLPYLNADSTLAVADSNLQEAQTIGACFKAFETQRQNVIRNLAQHNPTIAYELIKQTQKRLAPYPFMQQDTLTLELEKNPLRIQISALRKACLKIENEKRRTGKFAENASKKAAGLERKCAKLEKMAEHDRFKSDLSQLYFRIRNLNARITYDYLTD